jgi:hypothetical protein
VINFAKLWLNFEKEKEIYYLKIPFLNPDISSYEPNKFFNQFDLKIKGD